MKRNSSFVSIFGALVISGCMGTPSVETTTTTAALTTGAAAVDCGGSCNPKAYPYTTCTVKDANSSNLTQMHCCPYGSGMQGFFAATDSLYCRSVTYDQGLRFYGGLSDGRSNCRWRQQPRTVQQWTTDTPPQLRNFTMNGCNTGEYMIGIHQGFNRIACCPSNQAVGEFVDGPHLRSYNQTLSPYSVTWDAFHDFNCGGFSTMHSCGDFDGDGSPLMVGVSISANQFICAN